MKIKYTQMKRICNKIIGIRSALRLLLFSGIVFYLYYFLSHGKSFSTGVVALVFLFYAWKNKFILIGNKSIDIFILFFRIKRIKLIELKKIEFVSGVYGEFYLAGVGFYMIDGKEPCFITNLSRTEIAQFKQHLKILSIDYFQKSIDPSI